MFFVSYSGSLQGARLLVGLGAKLNAAFSQPPANEPITPLEMALSLGHLELGRFYLSKGARMFDPSGKAAGGIMYGSVVLNKADVVAFIIAKGFDPDIKYKQGVSPLIKGAEKGALQSIRMQLSKGAKVNVRASNGTTALMMASQQGKKGNGGPPAGPWGQSQTQGQGRTHCIEFRAGFPSYENHRHAEGSGGQIDGYGNRQGGGNQGPASSCPGAMEETRQEKWGLPARAKRFGRSAYCGAGAGWL